MQHLQSIEEIFQRKLFKIPDYQRGYAWEKDQWQDLIEDIELMEEGQEHYTGTLVIHAAKGEVEVTDDDGDNYIEYEVVDGQQRLTTITILMRVLAREFLRVGGKANQLAQGIKKKFISTTFDGASKSRLTLNRDTHEFFLRNIIAEKSGVSGAEIMSAQRLLDAQRFFTEYFIQQANIQGDQYAEWLRKVYTKVSSRMKLTVYLVPRASEVGVIFEVMNNRGKQLTEMEKVKNYLLYLSSKLTCGGGDDLACDINATWTYIFESLMAAKAFSSDHENQLLRNNWLMSVDYQPKNWSGSNSVKKHFSLRDYQGRHQQLRDDVREYVGVLKDSCTAYCDIIAPRRAGAFSRLLDDQATARKLIEMTDKFLRIGAVASFVPLLMVVRLRYPDQSSLYLEYLELCEKFAFRVFRFAEKRSNTGQTTLFRFGYELFTGSVNAQACYDNLRGLLLYYAPTTHFVATVGKIGEDWYNWYGLKYLLYEYELHLAKHKPVKMDWITLQKKDKQDTIEHILPQTPTRDYWTSRWTTEQIKAALNDIGNLALTFDNSVYGNKGFDEKRGDVLVPNCYANSMIFMEKEVARCSEWTYETYLKRRERMVRWMTERWHVSDAKQLDIHIEEDADIDAIAEESPEMSSEGVGASL